MYFSVNLKLIQMKEYMKIFMIVMFFVNNFALTTSNKFISENILEFAELVAIVSTINHHHYHFIGQKGKYK